jgi:type II secretory ATPase GspE/PulE/Tfp pilus assembly ATPase PilB-like protein/DNA-binding NarL/FixJ family response regulator
MLAYRLIDTTIKQVPYQIINELKFTMPIKPTILIVDDEPDFLKALGDFVRSENYDVVTVQSANKGYEQLCKQSFDLVLSDFRMPDMNGIKFLIKVKEKWPATVRILCTAYPSTDVSIHSIQDAGVFKVLKKPIDLNDLEKTLRIGLQIYKFKQSFNHSDIHFTKNKSFRFLDQYKDRLVKESLLTKDQLKEVLLIQHSTGKGFIETLLKLNLINEDIILSFLGSQIEPLTISLKDIDIEAETFKLIPEEVARSNEVIALYKQGGVVTLALTDPYNFFAIMYSGVLIRDEINFKICTQEEIISAIEENYSSKTGDQNNLDADITSELLKDTEDFSLEFEEHSKELEVELNPDSAPIINTTNQIILDGVNFCASDIHISSERNRMRVRYRIDGVLIEGKIFPVKYLLPVISRIKVLASLDITLRHIPQDGRLRLKTGKNTIDTRISTYPSNFGENLVLRLLPKADSSKQIDALGFSESDQKKIQDILHKSNGVFLTTGPTGSGKTTTLYSFVKALDSTEKNIMTIDDPIEYQLENIVQGEVNEKQGFSFSKALRSMLRQDPDIILVGEIRDNETADIAFKAGITGHLVLSTLHTISAANTLLRLINLGLDSATLASSLICIMSQRLARKICTKCKVKYQPENDILEYLEVDSKFSSNNFYKGTGCQKCYQTGYKGRIGIYEVLVLNDEIREMITSGCTELEIENFAIKQGMQLLKKDGLDKVLLGITTVEEIARIC